MIIENRENVLIRVVFSEEKVDCLLDGIVAAAYNKGKGNKSIYII